MSQRQVRELGPEPPPFEFPSRGYDSWKTANPYEGAVEDMSQTERAERWRRFLRESARMAKAWAALPAAERERIERERMERAPW
jgi:hypothetical protein